MKKIISCLIVLFMLLPVTNVVMAAENNANFSKEVINGAYYYQRDKSTGKVMTGHANKFYMNGRLSYCIEPLVQISTHVYDSTTDWSITGLTQEQIDYIEKVGYFGYEYSGHNSDRYYMAAQELIWEKARNVDAKYTTERNGGTEIDLSKEKNEILNLMNNYDIIPDIDTNIETNMGSTLILEDANKVLNQFSLDYDGINEVSIQDNKLIIKVQSNFIGKDTIKFVKRNYDSQINLIYYKASSQTLASLRISNPLSFEINLKVNGGKIEVNKNGEKIKYENGNYSYENIKLENVTFGVYANEDIKDANGKTIYKKYELVDTIKTNEFGVAILDNLYFGKYFITELESSADNMLDSQKYYFEINNEDFHNGQIIEELKFQNYLAKGSLEFTKTDFITGKVIPDTEIMIFTEDDRLIYQGKTDSEGKIVINNLLAGQKYYLIERNPATGYKLNNNKLYFEIKENGEIVKVGMTNEKIIHNVPNTESNKDYIFESVCLICILIGTGAIIYVFKKNNSK